MRRILAATAALLAATPAQAQSPEALHAAKVSPPVVTEAYGPDPHQMGELRLPKGRGPFPVAVVIHGGCWTHGFDTLRGTAPLADALTAAGVATWNIEYRQLGEDGAGWPGTFQDWGAAVDHLRVLAKTQPLDLTRVGAVGHSAGAHAALWVAARPGLSKTSAVRGKDPLRVRTAIAIDGPGDLTILQGLDVAACGKPVVAQLMGGTPAEQPARYAEGSPAARLPMHARQAIVSSELIAPPMAEAYAAAGAAKGDKVEVLTIERGTHFDVISPALPNGQKVIAFAVERLK